GCEPEHFGVHAPATQSSPFGHCVASEHWSAGATQLPSRHFEPAPSDAHSPSLLHPENEEPSPLVPSGTQETAPPESLQMYPVGHPDAEQSPGWQMSSVPQLSPGGQSDGDVQLVPDGCGLPV